VFTQRFILTLFMSIWWDYVPELRPIVYLPGGTAYIIVESHIGMMLTGENRWTRRETCPSATLSTKNPTWTDPVSAVRGRRLTAWAMERHHIVVKAVPLHARKALGGRGGIKKVKQSHYMLWRRLWEKRYSSYSFTTSALDRVLSLSGIEHRTPDRPARSQTLYWLSYLVTPRSYSLYNCGEPHWNDTDRENGRTRR
jgi:hypothetical protein